MGVETRLLPFSLILDSIDSKIVRARKIRIVERDSILKLSKLFLPDGKEKVLVNSTK